MNQYRSRDCKPRRRRSTHIMITALAAGGVLGLATASQAETIRKVAIINGAQEVPPITTGGAGCGQFVIDTVANTLTYRIVFSGLSSAENAAHIHGPADAGMTAPPVHTLLLGNPKVGVWNYLEAQEADILAGKMYVNIHTVLNGGGEIRGQIVDMAAVINADQENPSTGTAGVGFGLFNVDRCANTLSYHIEFSGLSSAETVAHIHGYSLHTTNAPPVHTLPLGSPKTGVWNYNEADEPAILAGRTYVNIHSMNHMGGEIRGQISPTIIPLDGTQEAPPVASPGHGCGIVALDPAANTLSYFLSYGNMTGPSTMAHIHGFAPPGTGAGILHNIGTGLPAKNTWNYGAPNAANVLAGLTYFNVHTAANVGGEIRGQIQFPPPPCVGDSDCNGEVNVSDLLGLLGTWGPCPAAPAPCPSDFDRDGMVAVTDLLALLGGWGTCP